MLGRQRGDVRIAKPTKRKEKKKPRREKKIWGKNDDDRISRMVGKRQRVEALFQKRKIF